MTTKGASKVMECFGVKRGESVLIVVDTSTPTSISKSLFEAARDIRCEVMILTMLPRSRHGEEPPPAVAEAMLKADAVGEKARNIAELGIGINPEAKLIGNVLEDEKVGGTVHIALGDNSCFGGDIIAGIHLDGIIKKPVLFLDGEKFILSHDMITQRDFNVSRINQSS